jgi:hypothetical protein
LAGRGLLCNPLGPLFFLHYGITNKKEFILIDFFIHILALYRMLEQYLTSSSQDYDSSQAKNIDFFNQREQMAIGAGLESMKVIIKFTYSKSTGNT